MPRYGGNPELEQYQFKQKGKKPLKYRIAVNIDEDMKMELDKLPNKIDFIREAIKKALLERK